jgi:hypothetical protein
MPRASLSTSLLSTHTSGVKKNYLHTGVGRKYAFISPAQFRNKTFIYDPPKIWLLTSGTGTANFISDGYVFGSMEEKPCYWNIGTNSLTMLSLSDFTSGEAFYMSGGIIVGQVNKVIDGVLLRFACYWDTNYVLHILSQYNSTTGIARGVSNNTVVGTSINQPHSWVIPDNQRTVLDLDSTYTTGNALFIQNSITVGNVDNLPCYWDADGLTLLTRNGYTTGSANGIDNNIVVGHVGNRPCYWNISTEELTLLPSDGLIGNAVFISNGYIVGHVNHKPCYWDSSYQLRYCPLTTQCVAYSSGVATAISNGTISGIIDGKACYWRV